MMMMPQEGGNEDYQGGFYTAFDQEAAARAALREELLPQMQMQMQQQQQQQQQFNENQQQEVNYTFTPNTGTFPPFTPNALTLTPNRRRRRFVFAVLLCLLVAAFLSVVKSWIGGGGGGGSSTPVEPPQGTGTATVQDVHQPLTRPPHPATVLPHSPPTESPDSTPPPTTHPETRTAQVKDYLISQGIATEASLNDAGSAQAKALNFIAVGDTAALPVPDGDKTTKEGYDFMTRYVLSVLYYGTKGELWHYGLNFLKPFSVCYWYSVLQYPDLSQEFRGAACTEEGEIAALFLTRNNIVGPLPTELALLTSLAAIDMNDNSFSGSIPKSYQSLTALQNFFVKGNQLTGSVPAFGSSIRNINLANNSFSGNLDNWVGTNMTSMKGMALDLNQLTGELHTMINSDHFPILEQLYLSDNQFTGNLSQGFNTLSTLTHIDLSHNDLSGSLPGEFMNEMPNLKALDINNNPLTGTLPTIHHADNSSLELLALQNCSFDAQTIPTTISNLPSLKFLDLSWNAFKGKIPVDALTELTLLENLFLAENPFKETTLGDWLPKLTNLQEVSIKSTKATGPIPDLSALTDLVLLDLDHNQLTSSIPSSLGQLTNLRYLLLNRNKLTGAIPDNVQALPQLDLFFFEDNATPLNGSICDGPLANKKKEDDNLLSTKKKDVTITIGECSSCPCCVVCCKENQTEGEICNDNQWVPDYDPVWETSFKSNEFAFGPKTLLKNDPYH